MTTNIDSADAIRLNVYVLGDKPTRAFPVRISRSADVLLLADAIVAVYKQQFKVEIADLELFKPVDALALDDERLPMNDVSVAVQTMLRIDDLSFYWPNGSDLGQRLIHVVVKPNIRNPPLDVTPTNIQEATSPEAADVLTGLTRQIRDAQIDYIKLNKKTSSSSAAEPKNFRRQQATPGFIMNGRPVNNTGRPVVLYHEVFGRFLAKLRSTDANEIPSETYKETTKYLTISQALYDTEIKGRDSATRSGLRKLLGDYLQKVDARGVKPDGIITGQDFACCVLVEMKNEIGAGGSDPSVQVAQSYGKYWGDPAGETLLVRCCCPSILIAIAGPWMCIFGAVFLDRPVVQPLTDYLWVGRDPARPLQVGYLARVFHCISLACKELEVFYKSPRDQGSGRFYPYVTHYNDSTGQRVDFDYVQSLKETVSTRNKKLVFLAKTRNEDNLKQKQIVVKFVQRYCSEAHKLLSQNDLAPELLYDGTADLSAPFGPDYSMIVMEFIDGVDLESFRKYPLSTRVDEDIDRALQLLHAQEFVFGDLRDPNVMLVKDSSGEVTRAKLIDFDWCGKHLETRYPFNMNIDIPWPEEAKPGKLMDMNHDKEMRKKLDLLRERRTQ